MDVILIHETYNPIHKVIHIAERSRLRTVSIDCDVLTVQSLNDEVAHNAAIIRMHAWTIGIKNADHADVDFVTPLVVEAQSFRRTLALVIARPQSSTIYMA